MERTDKTEGIHSGDTNSRKGTDIPGETNSQKGTDIPGDTNSQKGTDIPGDTNTPRGTDRAAEKPNCRKKRAERSVYLDFSRFSDREELHEFLGRRFSFGDHYGKNLDALYDELTSLTDDVEFLFAEDEADTCCEAVCPDGEPLQSEEMQRYCRKVRRVIEDAAEENGHIHI